MRTIQLADVLDAEFLKDDDKEEERARNKVRSDSEDRNGQVKGGLDVSLEGDEEADRALVERMQRQRRRIRLELDLA
jgi:hypothetical protein